MRAQIITGIENAMGENSFDLTDGEIEALTESILDALSQTTGNGPTLVTATAGPALSLSAADVVAMVASTALDQREAATPSAEHDPFGAADLCIEFAEAGGDRRAYRQFLFAVQRMFGVRVRSTTNSEGEQVYAFAGSSTQVASMRTVCRTLHTASASVTEGMSAEDRAAFWATLGHLVSTTPNASALIDANGQNFDAATIHINDVMGPTRNLNRITPASEGPVREAAEALVTSTMPTL